VRSRAAGPAPHRLPIWPAPPCPPQDARGDLLPCRALREKFKAARRDVYAPGEEGGEESGGEEGSGEGGGEGGGGEQGKE
jgi:hypothetical protein